MDDRKLMRYLRGEVGAEERARLAARLAAEPRLAHRLRRLEATWAGLELAPPPAAPPGFAARVAARARSAGEREGLETSSRTPAWARAAVLAAGMAAGAGLTAILGHPGAPGMSSGSAEAAATAAGGDALAEAFAVAAEPESLAELYWEALAGEEP